MIKKLLSSPRETAKLGRSLAEIFLSLGPSRDGATVIAFTGNLGAGKTSFIKSFLKALGVKGRVMSPTFVIMKSFRLPLRPKGFKRAYHMDAYRISPSDLNDLGFADVLENRDNIVLIEWAEKLKRALPKSAFWISLEHGDRHTERIFSIKLK